ncbi:hypothetical protein GGX14DRAFT_593649 [Mycena pura]|uniref:Uncharacterized protein n=1 Tax=Mycena pura TaxID=153505 RepID=A0AAD6UR21_9AGAR|nr:hypothetical protein GGX14DRAFT_593649 [Mycena pura]
MLSIAGRSRAPTACVPLHLLFSSSRDHPDHNHLAELLRSACQLANVLSTTFGVKRRCATASSTATSSRSHSGSLIVTLNDMVGNAGGRGPRRARHRQCGYRLWRRGDMRADGDALRSRRRSGVLENQVQQKQAARSARRVPDPHPLSEAFARCKAALAAGADVAFVEGLRTRAEAEEAVRVLAPAPVLATNGRMPNWKTRQTF